MLSVSNGAEGLRSDGVSAGEMVIPSSSISSPCVPIEYQLPYRRQTDNTYMVSRQSTSMPSITLEEYWSPPRRKILRAVGVRTTKRDWAAPAEPSERKNLNSSVLGAVIPGNLGSLSSER